MTWSNPEDIVMVIKNTLRAKLDVEVLASAFNMDKTTLLGNIIVVDNFDVYDEEGTKVFDGSDIVGIIADKSWFRIKTQDMFMDSFYNPNNRSIQYYLNVVKMYNFSLFANGVIFATSLPEDVPYTSLSFGKTTESVVEGSTKKLTLTALPTRANATITYTSSDSTKMTCEADSTDDRKVTITGVADGTAILTATSGSGESAVTGSITITITEAPAETPAEPGE